MKKKIIQMVPFDHIGYRQQLDIQEDVKYIKADFLIHQIELAFNQWQTRPWNEGVDFENFKEYLLPYRVENEPLDYWRDSISPLQKNLETYSTYYDNFRHSISQIENRFRTFLFMLDKKIPEPDLKNFKSDCIPTSKANLFVLRILGVPSAIDFIPHFANRNGRHYWATAIDPRINSTQVYQVGIYKAPKIYRRTYSHNPTAKPGKREYVPYFFLDPFNKDVTDLYIPTSEIRLSAPGIRNIRHGYLAIFNDLSWQPIACSKPAGQEIVFPKMGKDIVYLPVHYTDKKEMVPFAPPLILYSDGTVHPIIANKDSLQYMKLVRKYPNRGESDYWYSAFIDSHFEAADNPDFKSPHSICTIRHKPDYRYQFIPIDTTLSYRYWRFVANEAWRAHLSDLRFYDKHKQEIKGKIIGMDSTKTNELFDPDPLSMCMIPEWVGMDFGKPVALSQIRYLPRNDANGIFPDNQYELFYYDFPQGWISMGIKTATGTYIEYDDVPSNGLYWLRNHTLGQEERIFTWENGKAHFW